MWLAALAVLTAAATPVADGCFSLFAVRRSTGPNEVRYEACFTDGHLDADEPVIAYWVKYTSGGRRQPLSWLEREFVYGFDTRRNPDGSFSFRLHGFKERWLTIRGIDQDARAVVQISGVPAALYDIYVDVDESSSLPQVHWVDLSAHALSSGAKVMERLRR